MGEKLNEREREIESEREREKKREREQNRFRRDRNKEQEEYSKRLNGRANKTSSRKIRRGKEVVIQMIET